jgi:hypothetical protein
MVAEEEKEETACSKCQMLDRKSMNIRIICSNCVNN